MNRIIVMGGVGDSKGLMESKMRNGTSEPVYEKHIMRLLGIERLK